MNEPNDPPRLLDQPGASSALREALRAAEHDVPSTAQVEAMLARFPFPPSGGGSGDGGPPDDGGSSGLDGAVAGVAKGSVVAKLGAVVSLLAVTSGGVWLATRAPQDVAPASSAPLAVLSASAQPTSAPSLVVSAAPAASETARASARAVELPRVSAQPSATSLETAPASASASSSASPVRSEIAILREAHEALGASPARALALVDEHQRSHPGGSLAQEREVIRIRALAASGRRSEAKALADAFRKANPQSAHNSRLDALFPP